MSKIFYIQLSFFSLFFLFISSSGKTQNKYYLDKKIDDNGSVNASLDLKRGDTTIFIKGYYKSQSFDYMIRLNSSDEYVSIERRCFVEENDTTGLYIYHLMADTTLPDLRMTYNLLINNTPVYIYPFKDDDKIILKMCLNENKDLPPKMISKALLDIDKFIGYMPIDYIRPCPYKPKHQYPMQLTK